MFSVCFSIHCRHDDRLKSPNANSTKCEWHRHFSFCSWIYAKSDVRRRVSVASASDGGSQPSCIEINAFFVRKEATFVPNLLPCSLNGLAWNGGPLCSAEHLTFGCVRFGVPLSPQPDQLVTLPYTYIIFMFTSILCKANKLQHDEQYVRMKAVSFFFARS